MNDHRCDTPEHEDFGGYDGANKLSESWSSYSSNSHPGQIYYFNSRTGKRQWDFPSELHSAFSPSASGSITDDDVQGGHLFCDSPMSVPSGPRTPSLSGSRPILNAEKPRLNTNLPLLNEGLFKDDPDMIWKLEPFPIKQNLDEYNRPISYAESILTHYQQNYMLHSDCVSGTIISHENVDTHPESEEPSDYIEAFTDTIRPTNSPNWSSQNNMKRSRELSDGNPSEVVVTDELSPSKRRKLNRSAPVIKPESIGTTNLHFDINKRPLTDKSLSLILSPSSTASTMSSNNSANSDSASIFLPPTISRQTKSIPVARSSCFPTVGENMTKSNKLIGSNTEDTDLKAGPSSIASSGNSKRKTISTAYVDPETDQYSPCKRPKYKERRSEGRIQFNNNKQITNIRSNISTCKAADRLKALQEKLAKNQLLDAIIKSNNNDTIIENAQNMKTQCVASGSHRSAVHAPKLAFRRQATVRTVEHQSAGSEKVLSPHSSSSSWNHSTTDLNATARAEVAYTKIEEKLKKGYEQSTTSRDDPLATVQVTGLQNKVEERSNNHRLTSPRTPRNNSTASIQVAVPQNVIKESPAHRLEPPWIPSTNLVGRPTCAATLDRSKGSTPAANRMDAFQRNLQHNQAKTLDLCSVLVTNVKSPAPLTSSVRCRGPLSTSPLIHNVQSSLGGEVSLNSVGSRAIVDSRISEGPHSSESSRSIVRSRNCLSRGQGPTSERSFRDPFTLRPTLNSNFKYNGPAKLPSLKPATVVRQPSTKDMPMEDDDSRPEIVEMDWEPSESEQMEMISDVNIVRKTLGYQDLYPRTVGDDNLILIGQMKASYCIVLDSNILMGHLKFVEHLRDQQYAALEPLVLVVPWAVIQELDKLKDGRHDKANVNLQSLSKQQARHAVNWLNQQLSNKHPRVKGQTSFDLSAIQFHCKVADDCILKCCLQMTPFANHVVLLTNDKNLRNKASMMEVQTKSHEELQLALNKLTPATVAMLSTAVDMTKERNALDDPENQDAALADSILCRLQPVLMSVLGNLLETELVHAFGNMWKCIVQVKPPWLVVRDVIKNYVHHWIAISSEVFPNSAKVQFKVLNTFYNSKLAKSYNHSLDDVRSVIEASLAICSYVPRDTHGAGDGDFMQKLQDLKQLCSTPQHTVAKTSNVTETSLVTTSTKQNNNTENNDDEVRFKKDFALIKKPLEIIWEILNRFCVYACDFLQIKHNLMRYPEPSDQVTVEYVREGLYNITPIYQSLMVSLNTVMNVPVDQLYLNEKPHPAIIQFHETLTQTNLANNQNCLDDLPNYYSLYKFCISETNREILMTSLNQFNEFGHCLGLVLQETNRQFPLISKPVHSYMTE